MEWDMACLREPTLIVKFGIALVRHVGKHIIKIAVCYHILHSILHIH